MSDNKYPNSGMLSKNEKATAENRWPPYNGSLSVTCPHCHADADFWLSAWVKDGKRGKFFSVSVKPKQEPKQPDRAKVDDPPEAEQQEVPF